MEVWETIGTRSKTREGGHLDARLMDVVKRFQKVQMEDDFESGDVSSLSVEILANTSLDKFKLPSLNKYDGKTDSRSHMTNFYTIMLLQNVNDMVLCKVFPSTLTGLAEKWYQNL